MATRPSPSREPSLSRQSVSSTASPSRLSNPDIFSDDFAVHSRGNSPDASPTDSIRSFSDDDLPVHLSTSPTPQIPHFNRSHLNTRNFSRPSSTSKRPIALDDGHTVAPHPAISSVSQPEAANQRSSSVSSRFSIPPSQSPYVGPTAPSQPYAMYPQVTRAASIASQSTIRAPERPFVATGGPEHPYGMYPQNTVEEEEDDESMPTGTIALGFPGMGQHYQAGAQTSGHDIADIVGSDGHIEQLPPYTRYADNTIAKGAIEDGAMPNTASATDIPLSPLSQNTDSGAELNTGATRDAGELATEYNEKSRRSRLRRKVCLGISLCVWLLVAAVIIIAGTLGGVIGGVIGNNRASDAAADRAVPTATTTVWIDAGPLSTNAPAPTCQPGPYNMPTNNLTLHTNECVANSAPFTWGCEIDEPVPFTVSYGPDRSGPPTISLGSPSPGLPGRGPFNYGPQVPDLNGTFYPLNASMDKDDPNLGSAMFLFSYYNKLIVLPPGFVPNEKRSLEVSDLVSRNFGYPPVSTGDDPWFCWFNNTVLEFFIYSYRNTSAAAEGSTSYVYSTTASSTSASGAATSSSVTQVGYPSSLTTEAPAYPSSAYSAISGPWDSYTSSLPPSKLMARADGGNDSSENPPIYPQQIRMAEKRKPGVNIQPMCYKMHVNSDWSVHPVEGSQPVAIIESDYSGISSTPSKRLVAEANWKFRRQNVLDANCACQWYSS